MAEISARETVTAAALRGDAVHLRAIAAELPYLETNRYDRQRALAFAAALVGERERALAELKLGGEEETPQRQRVDVATLELLLGEHASALAALRLAVRDEKRLEPEVTMLLVESVRRGGASGPAILLGVGSGSPAQRTRSAVTLAPVVARDALDVIVPAVAVVSLVVAIIALARLPLLQDDRELAVPSPLSRGPVVVVAKPPRADVPERRAPSLEPEALPQAPTAVPVAVRTRSRPPAPSPVPTSPAREPQPQPSEVDRRNPPARAGGTVLAVSAQPPPSPPPAAPPPAPAASTASKSGREPSGKAKGHTKEKDHGRPSPPPAPPAPVPTAPAPETAAPAPPEQGHGKEHGSGKRK